MSNVELSKLDAQTKTQLAYCYSLLLLADANKEINVANLEKVLRASNNKIDQSWSKLMTKSFQGKNVNDMLSGGSSDETVVAPKGDKKKEPEKEKAPQKKVEEIKPEPAPADDADVGVGGMFDF